MCGIIETREINIGEKIEGEVEISDIGDGIVKSSSYSIEWIGGTREKVIGELPAFPDGVNEDRIIRLRFKVRPDGTVAEAIPLQKGSTILENTSVTTLKQWHFNSLESAAPQVLQEGTITFIYRLN